MNAIIKAGALVALGLGMAVSAKAADTNKAELTGNVTELIAYVDQYGDLYQVDLSMNVWQPSPSLLQVHCHQPTVNTSICVQLDAFFPSGWRIIAESLSGTASITDYVPLVSFSGACYRLNGLFSADGFQVRSINAATGCTAKP